MYHPRQASLLYLSFQSRSDTEMSTWKTRSFVRKASPVGHWRVSLHSGPAKHHSVSVRRTPCTKMGIGWAPSYSMLSAGFGSWPCIQKKTHSTASKGSCELTYCGIFVCHKGGAQLENATTSFFNYKTKSNISCRKLGRSIPV